MIIVDTSVWIDFLRGDTETKTMMIPYLRKKHVIAVSAVFGELLQGVKNKREYEVIIGFWQHLPKISEAGLFIRAGEVSHEFKLYASGVGLIDCYLLAAAMKNDFALWTKDKKLQKAINIISA